MPAPGARSASRAPARSVTICGAVGLLQLDGAAGLLELGLELVGLLALDALLDGLGGLVDEPLALLEARAGRRAHAFDALDFLAAGRGETHADGGGAPPRGGAAPRPPARRGGRRHGLGRD